ncbi:MAG: TRAP transporter large permease subunit, partial [Acidobacteriota bacterium]
ADFVEYVSGGNLMILLLLVAFMSLILGMGLPTTANYIVVSSLMAPVIVILGAKSGLVVPLVGEIPSTSAISSPVSPPKKRRVTMSA